MTATPIDTNAHLGDQAGDEEEISRFRVYVRWSWDHPRWERIRPKPARWHNGCSSVDGPSGYEPSPTGRGQS
jgi:hypothetical protein